MAVTTSTRAVLLPGQNWTDLDVCLPECHRGSEFLVQAVHVGPEIMIGATGHDVVQLPPWGISIPVYQQHQGAAVQVAFTALSPGPHHLSATLPAGQSTSPGGRNLRMRIMLLGGIAAPRRFEFNVHITGTCEAPFVCPGADPGPRRTKTPPQRTAKRTPSGRSRPGGAAKGAPRA